MHDAATVNLQLRHQRAAGILLLVGVALFLVPSVLGGAPLDDATAALEQAVNSSWWLPAQLATITAVLLWVAAVLLLRSADVLAPGRGAVATVLWTIAGAVVAVYVGSMAFGLMLAGELANETGNTAEHIEPILAVVSGLHYMSQALLGAAVSGLGLALIRRRPLLKILGAIALVSGLGWLTGAVVMNVTIWTPFSIFAVLALTILAFALLPRTSKRYRPKTA